MRDLAQRQVQKGKIYEIENFDSDEEEIAFEDKDLNYEGQVVDDQRGEE